MGGKKAAPPKKSDEEKAAEKKLKACESLLKAVKDDEMKKVEDAVAKGADINWQNDKGHTAAHVAAAFGALNALRYLHKNGADFEVINAKKMTPLMAAKHIGEDDAVLLIEALLAGRSGDDIGKGNDSDDDEVDDAELAKAKAAASTASGDGKAAPSAGSSAAAPELEVLDDARKEAYPASEGPELEVVEHADSKKAAPALPAVPEEAAASA